MVSSNGQVPPVSVCNPNCLPGSSKKKKEGAKFCCYDCSPCPPGKVSTEKGKRQHRRAWLQCILKLLASHAQANSLARITSCVPSRECLFQLCISLILNPSWPAKKESIDHFPFYSCSLKNCGLHG